MRIAWNLWFGRTSTILKGLALLAIVFSNAAYSEGRRTTYQTLPNSNIRDYRAPSYVTEGNVTYQTLPGSTIRDYRAPTYVTKGNSTYQMLPGSIVRDYSAPAYVIKSKK